MRQLSKNNLNDNPFDILKASPRDGKAKIIELADEAGLSLDSEICNKARSDLTNPRNRITHEISWFPGVSPKKCHELALLSLSNPKFVLDESSLPPLVLANLWTAFFEALDDQESGVQISDSIVKFALLLENLSASDVFQSRHQR